MNATNQIITYLLQTAISLYLLAMLLRFLLQLVKADFYNPICQFLVKITNPLVLPLRKILPPIAGADSASLLLAVLLQMVSIAAILLLNNLGLPNVGQLIIWSVLGVCGLLLNIYFFALLAVIIMSWVAPGSNNPALYLLVQITEPVMGPIRKMLPSMGGLDFSPIVLFVIIQVLQIVLANIAAGVSLYPGLVIGL